jgi:hypothetical protein
MRLLFSFRLDATNYQNRKRNLVSTFDYTKSVVSGITENLPFKLGQSYTISVTAKDSSGNRITIGGETIYIHITNHCTRGANMAWNIVASTPSILASDITAQMTDNSDGTYTYTTSFSTQGRATIQILLLTIDGVSSTFYDSAILGSGTSYTNSSR